MIFMTNYLLNDVIVCTTFICSYYLAIYRQEMHALISNDFRVSWWREKKRVSKKKRGREKKNEKKPVVKKDFLAIHLHLRTVNNSRIVLTLSEKKNVSV